MTASSRAETRRETLNRSITYVARYCRVLETLGQRHGMLSRVRMVAQTYALRRLAVWLDGAHEKGWF